MRSAGARAFRNVDPFRGEFPGFGPLGGGFNEQLRKLNSDSLFETEFSDDELEELVKDLKVIDPKVFAIDNGHWKSTLDYYKWEREDERRNAANNT